MKIDRLLGILTILLRQERVTAPYLAERFEVSRRTIGRDIEDLCMAGIPVVTAQGAGGGISIAEGYKIDKSLLTRKEFDTLAAGLRGVATVTGRSAAEQILDKFSPGGENLVSMRESLVIDLASFYGGSLTGKIACIREAVAGKRVLAFDYYSGRGKERRTAEPYLVLFQWGAWYLSGYCPERKGFRLFKLNRLWELEDTGQTFELRELPPERERLGGAFFDGEVPVLIRFSAEVEYRVVEEYGPNSYERAEDGMLLFRQPFKNKEHLFEWVLGFGDSAELLEPSEWREELIQRIKNTMARYGKQDS